MNAWILIVFLAVCGLISSVAFVLGALTYRLGRMEENKPSEKTVFFPQTGLERPSKAPGKSEAERAEEELWHKINEYGKGLTE